MKSIVIKGKLTAYGRSKTANNTTTYDSVTFEDVDGNEVVVNKVFVTPDIQSAVKTGISGTFTFANISRGKILTGVKNDEKITHSVYGSYFRNAYKKTKIGMFLFYAIVFGTFFFFMNLDKPMDAKLWTACVLSGLAAVISYAPTLAPYLLYKKLLNHGIENGIYDSGTYQGDGSVKTGNKIEY